MRRTPAVVVVAALASLLATPGFPQDPLSLFHRMQTALGGADRIAAIRDFEQDVRAESLNGATGQSIGEVRKRTRWIAPNYLRVDQSGPGSTYVLFTDGAGGWEILPGTQQAVALSGGELEFATRYVDSFRLRTWLADRDPRIRITSPAPRVVRISDGNESHQQDITLDAASWLPVNTRSITLSDPAHPVESNEVVTDWETVQGIRVPRRWTVYRAGVVVAEARDARSAINAGLRLAELAAKPTDGRPIFQ